MARRDNQRQSTPNENFAGASNASASGGTDHSTAASLFVAGRAVHGGFYGERPSLADLDQGDLNFTTDFRSVYATVLRKVLGTDPKSVLSGRTFPDLALL